MLSKILLQNSKKNVAQFKLESLLKKHNDRNEGLSYIFAYLMQTVQNYYGGEI